MCGYAVLFSPKKHFEDPGGSVEELYLELVGSKNVADACHTAFDHIFRLLNRKLIIQSLTTSNPTCTIPLMLRNSVLNTTYITIIIKSLRLQDSDCLNSDAEIQLDRERDRYVSKGTGEGALSHPGPKIQPGTEDPKRKIYSHSRPGITPTFFFTKQILRLLFS
jgi:hypothetical protein